MTTETKQESPTTVDLTQMEKDWLVNGINEYDPLEHPDRLIQFNDLPPNANVSYSSEQIAQHYVELRASTDRHYGGLNNNTIMEWTRFNPIYIKYPQTDYVDPWRPIPPSVVNPIPPIINEAGTWGFAERSILATSLGLGVPFMIVIFSNGIKRERDLEKEKIQLIRKGLNNPSITRMGKRLPPLEISKPKTNQAMNIKKV